MQIAYSHLYFDIDFTYNGSAYLICTQTVQALSVITACIPYLQPLMEGLNTGLLWAQTDAVPGVRTTKRTLNGSKDPNFEGNANDEIQFTFLETNSDTRTCRDHYEYI